MATRKSTKQRRKDAKNKEQSKKFLYTVVGITLLLLIFMYSVYVGF